MQGLIQKSGYIKPGGGAGHYAEYIGTRDGVELLNAGNQYLKYIAERPRSHGLFSNANNTNLKDTMKEVGTHPAPVWTFIYSLKREDAARLGYDSAESWRKLLLAHQTELAEAMKIPPNQFRWCAAFHDEKHHPHIHMMVWSADPKQGYLTEQGIETMRSKLTNDIFQDELLHLYKQKDLSYQEVRDAAQEVMCDLIREMKSGVCDCPVIEDKVVLAARNHSDIIMPDDIFHEFEQEKTRINSLIHRHLPRVKKFSDLITAVSVPATIFSAANSSAFPITVGAAVLSGTSALASVIGNRIEEKYKWVNFSLKG